MPKRTIPKFRTEAEEAAWWDKNRASLDTDFAQAAVEGRLRKLDAARLEARLKGISRTVSIQIPEEDITLARVQAAKKGLPYQVYLQSLLHRALREAE